MAYMDDIIEKINITGRDKRLLVAIPLAIFALSVLIIAFNGISLSTDLEGGTLVKVMNISTDGDELQTELREFFDTVDIKVRSSSSITSGLTYVEVPADIPSASVQEYFEENYPDADVSFSVFNPSVSKQFQQTALQALIFALIGMSVVVFVVFRSPVPSLAVVLSAISDISITVGVMSLLGFKLSLGTIAALLMVIGYSVDSDILLTTRLLKRRGDLYEKVRSAMKTGLTMTLTTLSAMIVLLLVSSHETLDSIATVLVIALIFDLMNTWMLNTGILMWHIERIKPVRGRRRK